MKNDGFAFDGGREKSPELPDAANALSNQPLCHRAKGYCLDRRFDLPGLTGLLDHRFVFKFEVNHWQARRGVPQDVGLRDNGAQDKLISNEESFSLSKKSSRSQIRTRIRRAGSCATLRARPSSSSTKDPYPPSSSAPSDAAGPHH